MEWRANEDRRGSYIVVTLDPRDKGAARAVVPASKEQSKAQASVLDFKPFSHLQ